MGAFGAGGRGICQSIGNPRQPVRVEVRAVQPKMVKQARYVTRARVASVGGRIVRTSRLP
jgi:hypothetical protein